MLDALSWPWALAGLVALPAIVWLHRRALPDGDRPFSAFFLLPVADREGRPGARIRGPWLLLVRLVAAALLVALAVGFARLSPGTLVLASGPIAPDPAWAEPVTYVRAGRPPRVEPDPLQIAPVAGRPDEASALLLGRRLAPEARLVRISAPTADGPRVRGAGAAVDQGNVAVAVEAPGATRVTVTDAAGARHALDLPDPREGLGRFRLVLPPGGAVAEVAAVAEGEFAPAPFAFCVPDAGPVPVAEAGFGPEYALDEVFDTLETTGLLVRTPWAVADWRPAASLSTTSGAASAAPLSGREWAPFKPQTTLIIVPQSGGAQVVAPLIAAAPGPGESALVRGFAPIDRPAIPTFFGADSVVADQGETTAFRFRRFGFRPLDSDLADSPTWLLHTRDALRETQFARSRCRTHRAGEPLVLAVDSKLTLRRPSGSVAEITPVNGRAHLEGLDELGVFRLEQGGEVAFLAVTANESAQLAAAPLEIDVPAGRSPPPARPYLATAAALLLIVSVLGARRSWSPAAWLALGCLVFGAFDPRFGWGERGAVALAIDVSGSMPLRESKRAVGEAMAALVEHADVRSVAGDDRVQALASPDPFATGGGPTRGEPLLRAAAALAGPTGAVVYVTDGGAPDLPVPAGVPVFPLIVTSDRPDAAVRSAIVRRLGDRVFVRTAFVADGPTSADVEIDRFSAELPLEAGEERTVTARIRPDKPDEVRIRVQAHDDPRPENDQRRFPVDLPPGRRMAVIGAGAAGSGATEAVSAWGVAAGFEVDLRSPESLATVDERLWSAAALWLADLPTEHFTGPIVASLTAYVRSGGWLVLSGRTRAFGPGGWGGSELEALAPVLSDPRPPGAGRLAVALLLDRSGSMAEEAGGVGPVAVGALVRGLAARLRPDDDRLAVLAFGTEAQLLLGPTAPGELGQKSLPVPAVSRGGTLLRPALRAGLESLAGTEADARVLLVVTDGAFADGGEPMPIDALRSAGVRVVSVLVGETVERMPLEDLAQATGGQILVSRPGEVLRWAASGAVGAGPGGLLAGAAQPSPGPAWGMRVGGDPPPIAGRARVRERPGARVLARVDGEPLLAEWQVGAGRVLALATDAFELSGTGWATLFAPARAGLAGGNELEFEERSVTLRVAQPDQAPSDGELLRSGRPPEPLAFVLTAPGLFRADLPDAGDPREAPFTVRVRIGSELVAGRVAAPLPEELVPRPADVLGLEAQAALTGGRVLEHSADVEPVLAALRRAAGRPLAPLLYLLALAALLLDVAGWAGLHIRRLARSGS